MMISQQQELMRGPVYAQQLCSKILPYRDQEQLRNRWLKKRLETVLPMVMRRSGIDLWVVCCREYHEDPVLTTLVPCAMMTARRTTILVFHLQKDGSVHPMAITRPGIGLEGYYESMWTNPKNADCNKAGGQRTEGTAEERSKAWETQWECLNRVITQCDPRKIGIDISDTFAFADGLSHTMYQKLTECLSAENRQKLCSAEAVCIGWLETRTEEELSAYSGIVQMAHGIIDEAFSSRVVLPGVTTNEDVKYFMMQRAMQLGLMPWFDFEVSIRRAQVGEITEEAVILPGDMLHCDVGIRYLNLCTDTQENAYVLKLGEEDAPEYLKDAMAQANRLQEITVSHFRQGRTGNEVLSLARQQAIREGIDPCIYSHPIGYHGHGAGPTIGLWDMQEGVPGMGDYPLYDDTCYSLELSCRVSIRPWNVEMMFGAETDVIFTGGQVYYAAGRQTGFHLIR